MAITDIFGNTIPTGEISAEVKHAMDTLCQNMAFETEEDYTDEISIIHNWAGNATITSISATFNQGTAVIYPTTPLTSLRQYLTVVAHYDNSSAAEVSAYALDGTLAAGTTSTITVSYDGKSTSFTVTVSASRLPSEYTEVEYLEANQTDTTTGAYINTGVKFTDPTTAIYRVDCQWYEVDSSWTQGKYMIGTRQTNTGTTNNIGFGIGYTVNSGIFAFSNNPAASYIPSNPYDRHNVVGEWTASSLSIKVDDNEEVVSSLTTRGTSGYNISLFGVLSLSTAYTGATYVASGKIYSAEIEQDGTVLATLIPCTRNSDNAVGMYDLVNERFITPSAAGNGSISAITAGSPV